MRTDLSVKYLTTLSDVRLDFLSGVLILYGFAVRISSVAILSGVRIVSRFFKKVYPVSVCPAGQGQDKGVRIFTVAVHLTLISIENFESTWKNMPPSASNLKTS